MGFLIVSTASSHRPPWTLRQGDRGRLVHASGSASQHLLCAMAKMWIELVSQHTRLVLRWFHRSVSTSMKPAGIGQYLRMHPRCPSWACVGCGLKCDRLFFARDAEGRAVFTLLPTCKESINQANRRGTPPSRPCRPSALMELRQLEEAPVAARTFL